MRDRQLAYQRVVAVVHRFLHRLELPEPDGCLTGSRPHCDNGPWLRTGNDTARSMARPPDAVEGRCSREVAEDVHRGWRPSGRVARWQGPQHASPAGGAVSSAPLFPFRQGSFHGLGRAPSKGSSTSKKPLKPKLEPRSAQRCRRGEMGLDSLRSHRSNGPEKAAKNGWWCVFDDQGLCCWPRSAVGQGDVLSGFSTLELKWHKSNDSRGCRAC